MDFSVTYSSDRTMAMRSTQPLVKMSTRNIPGGKGRRCVRLTTTPSCAECREIWEPKPPGTLWATPGRLRDCFSLLVLCVCVCVCVWALLAVCSFIGHRRSNCFLFQCGRTVQFCPLSCLPPILTLNTNPPLHLTLPATHRPAAVLLLLT